MCWEKFEDNRNHFWPHRVIVWLGRWTLPYNYIIKEIQSRQVLWKKNLRPVFSALRLTRHLLLSLSFWSCPCLLQALGRYPPSFCVRYSQEFPPVLASPIESGVCLFLKWLLGSLGLGQSCVSHSTLNKLYPGPSKSISEFFIDFKELAWSPLQLGNEDEISGALGAWESWKKALSCGIGDLKPLCFVEVFSYLTQSKIN